MVRIINIWPPILFHFTFYLSSWGLVDACDDLKQVVVSFQVQNEKQKQEHLRQDIQVLHVSTLTPPIVFRQLQSCDR